MEIKLGSGIVVMYQGKVLVCKMADKPNHSCAKHWLFPGGKPEKGETPFTTAVREAEEEINLVLDTADKISRFKWLTMIVDLPWKANYFLIRLNEKEYNNLIICQREFTEYKWLSPYEALKLKGPKSNHIEIIINNHLITQP